MNNNIFDGKKLLITGGTGSFGNVVLDRFLNSNIEEIRIFSRDEKKQDDMRKHYKNDKIKFILGDVREESSLDYAVKGVDYIFHAAALKQVPSCEFYPLEAIKTNVIGTSNVLNTGIKYNVQKIVCLSTDKAVYPINAMGMSKAMMEKVMVASSRINEATVLCGTRYGNVMASRGSVIPRFIEQIQAGEPITVTNPNMTRFMMTLQDAVDLVLYAFQNGKRGDIFVQKSPASTIQNIAEATRILMNKPDHPIVEIGSRHGEKLAEVLVSSEDMMVAENLGQYFRIPADVRGLNYEIYLESGNGITQLIESYTSDNTKRLDLNETIELMKQLPFFEDPEFTKA